MVLGLRVDVCTRIGMREGVPRLLELFRKLSLKASFFVTFGPDSSGKALRRLRQPAFLLKMLRTNPLRLYGMRTLLSGTLLPALPVGEGAPDLLRAVVSEGHELGIHGYDHVRWQDGLERMQEEEVGKELFLARSAYERILGSPPLSSAAPGWRCSPAALKVQEKLGFVYAADVRGTSPFIPVDGPGRFTTLQIPTTLPTVDELLGRQPAINDFLLCLLRQEINVHTIHAEVEGRKYLPLLEEFLAAVRKRGVAILRLCDVAETLRQRRGSLPVLPIKRCQIPGRAGWVSCQDGAVGSVNRNSLFVNRLTVND